MRLISGLLAFLFFAPAVLPETFPKLVVISQRKPHKVKRHKAQKHRTGKPA
jgi:hypothetical protein